MDEEEEEGWMDGGDKGGEGSFFLWRGGVFGWVVVW